MHAAAAIRISGLSHGSQVGVRSSSTHAQPAVISTTAAAIARPTGRERWLQSIRPPIATSAAIAGATATV
jgi:hypothetical protein